MARPTRSRRGAGAETNIQPRAAHLPSRGRVVWDADVEAYLLEADDTQYRVLIGAADEHSSFLAVDGRVGGEEAPWHSLLRSAGMLFRETEGGIVPAAATHQRTELVELHHSPRGRAVSVKFVEALDGKTRERTLEVRLSGRSLEIQVDAPGGPAGDAYCGFSLGKVGPDEATAVPVPGLPEPLLVLPGGLFLCAYADRFRGKASSYPPGASFYRLNTEGESGSLRDIFYLTLSADPLDPLPSLRRPAAPYREEITGRVLVDLFSDAPFAEDQRIVRMLQSYGLVDVLLVYRNWQQFGYDRRSPLFYPANPDRGGNEELRDLLVAARRGGWLPSVREEYATIQPDCPYWHEKCLPVWWDGQPRVGRGGAAAVSADRMLDFARLETTKIQRNYPCGAAFADGHTAWNPEGYFRQVDSMPNSGAGAEADAAAHVEGLLAFLREIHEGPVIGSSGEGSVRFDTFAAGMAEGVIRGIEGGPTAPLVLDYELEEVRPRLVGFGAGTYSRFSGAGGEAVEPTRVNWDAYRAIEVALGHGGYLSTFGLKPAGRGGSLPGGSAVVAVREYHLLRALQELYLEGPVRSVRYQVGEELLSLAEALRDGIDLVHPRVRIEYGSGLTVCVNCSNDKWSVAVDEAEYELPPNGWVASSPRQRFLAYSALVGGQWTDFCRSAHYTFVDSRSQHVRTIEGVQIDGSVVLLRSQMSGRQDLVMVGARQLTLGEEEYRLSERADVRLTFLSPREIEITVIDSEHGRPVHVNWWAFSPAWKGNSFEVLEWEDECWVASRCQIQQTKTGPQLGRARPGVTYRVVAK